MNGNDDQTIEHLPNSLAKNSAIIMRQGFLKTIKSELWANKLHQQNECEHNVMAGFDLTTCDSYFMNEIEVFTKHILVENTYFKNHRK